MVTITEIEGRFRIEPTGFWRFLAFKNAFTISKYNIVSVYQNPEELSGWIGWRLPGTSIPFLFNAGTFYLNGKKNFWFVAQKANAIIVELKNEEFDKLIIEVKDPKSSIQLLSKIQ